MTGLSLLVELVRTEGKPTSKQQQFSWLVSGSFPGQKQTFQQGTHFFSDQVTMGFYFRKRNNSQ